MGQTKRFSAQWGLPIVIGVAVLTLTLFTTTASALTPLPTPDPIPGSYGLEATKTQPPPTQGATITTPGNNASFTSSPIRVNGLCPNGLLVQVLNNGVLVGAVMCNNGSFSVEVSLFAGTNELVAIVYDDLDQAGPESNKVSVTYTDTNLTAFGQLITLTSSFGRRAAPVNTQLEWPLQLSGGTGPYAFSIDWGDGSSAELKSQPASGLVTIQHVYKNAGIYQVNIRVTDVNGVSAFLQVIAVASGKVVAAPTTSDEGSATPRTVVVWIPAAIAVALLLPAFWLGRRSQVVSIRNKMLRERESIQQQ